LLLSTVEFLLPRSPPHVSSGSPWSSTAAPRTVTKLLPAPVLGRPTPSTAAATVNMKVLGVGTGAGGTNGAAPVVGSWALPSVLRLPTVATGAPAMLTSSLSASVIAPS
jgi:hypothetical protein